MKLIALRGIWKSKCSIKPGQLFDEDNQEEIDRLISAKAARPLQVGMSSGRGTVGLQTDEPVEVSDEDLRKLGLFKAISFEELEEMLTAYQLYTNRKSENIDIEVKAPGVTGENMVVEGDVSKAVNDDIDDDFADVTGTDNLTGETITSEQGNMESETKVTDDVDGGTPSVVLPPYSIPGIDSTTIDILVKNGFDTIEKVAAATKAVLIAIPSLGYNNAAKIFSALKGKK